jgi:bifunctional DNase/RNase
MRLRRPRLETLPLDVAAPELEGPVEDVREALASLPSAAREVLVAHYVEGLSCAEIAERLGSTPGAVRVRLHRARGQLRALLPVFAVSAEEVEMIEVVVDDVWVRIAPGRPARLADERLRIVLLREKSGERALPIWVGPPEGDSLTLQLRGESLPRPLTVDLSARLLEAAGGRIERVVVTRLEEQTFYAVVAVASGGEVRDVDARPSDALNLALRVDAPIYVDGAVLDEAGLVGEGGPALLDQACERIEVESVVGPPPPGEWQPHSLELVSAYRMRPGK